MVIFLLSMSTLSSAVYVGDITFYYEWRGNYGSCALDEAKWNPFYVAALSRDFMRLPRHITNPNNHPRCAIDHCLQIWGNRGISIVVKVSDTCYGCKPHDVDVSDVVFKMLDDPDKGRVKMTWQWANCTINPPGQSLIHF